MQTNRTCCPMCNLYTKNQNYDYCCKTCRDTKGQKHGLRCTYQNCHQQQYLQANRTCCPMCNLYTKNQNYDYCCKTCRDTKGQKHGLRCTYQNCHQQQYIQPTSTKNIDRCLNLKTMQQLYDPRNTICFYDKQNLYYEFTNFYPAQITINGITYPTSEHYFQAQKYSSINPQIAEQIRRAPTPRDAYNIANNNQNKQYIRKDWHDRAKIFFMKEALRAKFTQHQSLKQLLLNTNNKILVEHTSNDNYWGDNGDGTGQNQLGNLLMEIRNELQTGKLHGGNYYYQKYMEYKNKYQNLKSMK